MKALVGTFNQKEALVEAFILIVQLQTSQRFVSSSIVAAHRAPSQQKSLSLTDIYCPAPHSAGQHQYSDYLIDTPDTIIHLHTFCLVPTLHHRNILTIIKLDIEIMNKEIKGCNKNIADIWNSTSMEKPIAMSLE